MFSNYQVVHTTENTNFDRREKSSRYALGGLNAKFRYQTGQDEHEIKVALSIGDSDNGSNFDGEKYVIEEEWITVQKPDSQSEDDNGNSANSHEDSASFYRNDTDLTFPKGERSPTNSSKGDMEDVDQEG